MGLVDKPAFTAGELDPSLWERTNLDKYRNGLATARNWIISKTGSILTRPGRLNFAQCKEDNRAVRLYSPPGGGVVLEWGHLYVRVYNLTSWALIGQIAHAFTEDDLPNLHFETSGSYVLIFCAGKNVLKFNYSTGAFTTPALIFSIPPAPATGAVTIAGAPTGYNVQYLVTYVLSGEESLPIGPVTEVATGHNYVKLPIAAGQTNTIGATLGPVAPTTNQNPFITEMRVYRRPYDVTGTAGSGAWGYIGTSTDLSISGGQIVGLFTDIGADADYSHQPPSSLMPKDTSIALVANVGTPKDPGALLSNTGLVYQQRLLITDYVTDLQAIYAGQPGYLNNFYRNYPLDSASALKFKCGTSGYARVLRMLDSDGLVAFTAAGIYLNQGELNPDNITMTKKGKWIINPVVPPLAVPGGVIFLDSATNGIRNLLWSFEISSYSADEVSIYSNHLFRSRQLVTWNFQQGAFPLLWVVFTDGTAASFTFDYSQQMQAWTRHDGKMEVESCCGTTNPDQTFFVVKKTDSDGNVKRNIEVTLPRYVPPSYISSDPDYDKNASCAFMDGITSGSLVMNDLLVGDDVFTFAASEHDAEGNDDWSGVLNLDSGTSPVWASLVATPPADVKDYVYRFFDEDGSAIDLVLVAVIDSSHIQVQVQNVDEFPSDWAEGEVEKLYLTFNQITGLHYLDGEYPGVIVDGAVVASPNNDQENYEELLVEGGILNLPIRAAIAHVGRPIIADIQTLEIDTVEQSPTLIESILVNKIYVKVKDAKSLYIGPNFPNGANEDESVDGVSGMYPIDSFPVDYAQADPIIANRAQPAQTKRFEIMMQGDYSQQGKICVRQVDPVHAEILSFIPDVEIQKREPRRGY